MTRPILPLAPLKHALVLVLLGIGLGQFAFISWQLMRSTGQQSVAGGGRSVREVGREVVEARPAGGVLPSEVPDLFSFDDTDYGVVSSGEMKRGGGTHTNKVSAMKIGFYREEDEGRKTVVPETGSDVIGESYSWQQWAGLSSQEMQRELDASLAMQKEFQGGRGVDKANDIFTELAGSSIARISASTGVPWVELKNGHKLFLGAALNQDYKVRDIHKDSVVLDGPYGSLVISVKGQIIQ